MCSSRPAWARREFRRDHGRGPGRVPSPPPAVSGRDRRRGPAPLFPACQAFCHLPAVDPRPELPAVRARLALPHHADGRSHRHHSLHPARRCPRRAEPGLSGNWGVSAVWELSVSVPESATMTEIPTSPLGWVPGAPRRPAPSRWRQREDERHGQGHGSREPPQRLHSLGFGTDVPLAQPRLSAVSRCGLSRGVAPDRLCDGARFRSTGNRYSTTPRLPLKPTGRRQQSRPACYDLPEKSHACLTTRPRRGAGAVGRNHR